MVHITLSGSTPPTQGSANPFTGVVQVESPFQRHPAERGARQRCSALLLLTLFGSPPWIACAPASAPMGSAQSASTPDVEMLIRLSELEIEPASLAQYLSILRDEASASVHLEPGVICIFPMQEQQSPTQVRILEAYASRAAYEAHLQTPHFKHYKSSTQHMVKSLRLVDMTALDPHAMPPIFTKLDR